MSPKTAKIDLPYPLCVSQKLKFRFFPDIFTFRLLLTEGSPSYMPIFSNFYGLVYEIGSRYRVFCTDIFDTRRWQGPSPTSEVFAEFPPHHPEVGGAAFCFLLYDDRRGSTKGMLPHAYGLWARHWQARPPFCSTSTHNNFRILNLS